MHDDFESGATNPANRHVPRGNAWRALGFVALLACAPTGADAHAWSIPYYLPVPPEFLPLYHAVPWSYAVLAVISNCYPPV